MQKQTETHIFVARFLVRMSHPWLDSAATNG